MRTANSIQLSIHFSQVVDLVKKLPYQEQIKLAQIIEKETQKARNKDLVVTHFASETALAKDWLTPEEDEAWKNL